MRETQAFAPGALFLWLKRAIELRLNRLNKGSERYGRQANGNDRRKKWFCQALRETTASKHMFRISGGAVLADLATSASGRKTSSHILVRPTKQGAGHMAEGLCRSEPGKLALWLVTSVGGHDVVTALQGALMDSIPIRCLHRTRFPTSLIAPTLSQECDTVRITRPCTKHNAGKRRQSAVRVSSMSLPNCTHRRPGPLVLSISPKDVQVLPRHLIPPAIPGNRAERANQPKVSGDSTRSAPAN